MKHDFKIKLSSIVFLFILALATSLSSKSYSQYYVPNYFPGSYYGGCLAGPGCSTAYKAATSIGLGVDAINYGIGTYQYHKAQEEQIRQIQYQAQATRSAMNYQKQAEDYKNMMLVAPFFDDSIPKPKNSNSTPKVPSLTKRSYETR